MQSPAADNSPSPERLMQFAWGYAPPLIIAAAIQHGLFDTLAAHGPLTLDQLAHRTGTVPRALRPVADALVALNFLSRDTARRYALTPESDAFLVSSKPSFQGGIFKHINSQLIPKWLRLNETLQTGRPPRAVNDQDEGAPFFEQFVEDIFPMSYPAARTLAHHLNLTTANAPIRVLDLAAGSGVWGIALAEHSPHVRVTAVDWPRVLNVTRRVAQRRGLLDRFDFVPGDLHQAEFGQGHHVATLGHILHSEGERRSRTLLHKTFAALAPAGTLAIAEFLMNDDRTGPVNAALFSVNMLVNTDEGDTFTFPEISAWLQDAGFTRPRLLDAPGPSPLILADRPG